MIPAPATAVFSELLKKKQKPAPAVLHRRGYQYERTFFYVLMTLNIIVYIKNAMGGASNIFLQN